MAIGRRRSGLLSVVVAWLGLWAGSAWADSLALMSGAGQSGLGGSTSSQPLVVQVRNADGVAVAGRTIAWSTSNGFLLSAPSSVTDVNGNASVTFTYGNPGTTNIVASDSVGDTSASAPETSIGNDSITLISGGDQAGLIGATSAQPIVVEVRNAAGAPISGRTVQWLDQTAYSQVNAATSVTNANGQASMGFTYLQGPGLSAGGANISIRASNAGGGQFVDVAESSIGSGTATSTPESISGILGSNSVPIVLQLNNANGSPAAGVTVTWTDRLGNGFVTPTATTTVTNAAGQTSNTVKYTGCGTGDVEMTFAGGVNDVPFTAICAGTITLLSPNPINGTASTHSTTPLIIATRNQDGSYPVGANMTWSTSLGDAVPDAATSVIDSNGHASIGFTFGTVNSRICGTDPEGRTNCDNIYVTGLESIQFISGTDQIGTSSAAGGQPIVVQVLDASGNPVAGRTVNWSQSPIDSNGVSFGAPSSVTDASGNAQLTFTYQAPGRTSITATDSVTTAIVTTRVTAVGMNTFTVISGDHQSGLVGTHSAQPVVAELRDAAGNPIVGATVTWSYNCGPVCNTLDSVSTVTDAAGRTSNGFTFSATAGQSGFEAEDPVSRARAEFNAIAVGADSLSIISGNGQVGTTNSAGAQPFVVEQRDAAGNPVVGSTIFWSVTVPPGSAVADAASSVTDANGRASMTFTYGSNATDSTIVANDAALHQVLFTVTATEKVNHALIVSGNGQTGQPGTAGAQPIVVELRDAGNAPQAGQSVAWRIVSGAASLLTTTTTTNASGQVQATFNFGPTPGTSIIEAYDPGDPVNGQRVQATVTAVGAVDSLTIVSGDGQVLVANAESAPLVVELRDTGNAPVVGATIDWSASNGTLAAGTSVTDSNGRASNTVTTAQSGSPVTVQASSALATSAVTFSMGTDLANIPGLTPEQKAVAVALDNACPALADMSSPSAEQADLLARCKDIFASAGINPTATSHALEALLSKTAQAQTTAASLAIDAQIQNVQSRLLALRNGTASDRSNGLTFTGPGGMVTMTSLLGAFMDDAGATPAGAGFSRWGFFATGNIGRGEARANSASPAYDYDINGITAGVDYRQSDDWVSGAAVGYTHQDTDLADDAGRVALSGWSLSGYSTYSFKELWYVDGVLTYGHNRLTLERAIRYTLPLSGGDSTSIDQLATGKPGGTIFSAAVTLGGDFHRDAWGFSPYGQLIHARVDFDAYQESLRAGPGVGLGLAVDERSITSLTGILGARLSYTRSADWGVFAPIASLEWNHEFRSDPSATTARFIYDPTQTPFSVSGQPLDADYFRLGLGTTFLFTHGRSGFFLYQRTMARSGQSQDNLSLGMRIEF